MVPSVNKLSNIEIQNNLRGIRKTLFKDFERFKDSYLSEEKIIINKRSKDNIFFSILSLLFCKNFNIFVFGRKVPDFHKHFAELRSSIL